MIKFKRLSENAKIPTKATEGAAGLDLYSTEEVSLLPGCTVVVPLGISSSFSSGIVGIVKDRSGLAIRGIHVHGGVIDSDYRGEWKVIIHNPLLAPVVIRKLDRIAQVVFMLRAPQVIPVEVDSLDDTERGEGGFGSTGQ